LNINIQEIKIPENLNLNGPAAVAVVASVVGLIAWKWIDSKSKKVMTTAA
jgi:hypothetical protein